MKRAILAAALFAASCAALFAEGALVTLQNEESSTFYYVVDPAPLAGLSAGSPQLASRVADFFASPDAEPKFAPLVPDGQVQLRDLADGTHLLVGFFAAEDEARFPVRVMSLQADSRIGERFYAVYADPALISAARGAGRLAAFPPLGGQAVAAAPAQKPAAGPGPQPEPPVEAPAAPAAAPGPTAAAPLVEPELGSIATFADTYTPGFFTRESKGTFVVLPISDSRAWKRAGTRLSEVSGEVDNGGVRVVLTARDGFSPSVSYFFYVFANRADKENGIALELRPRAVGARGACLLWQKGVPAPRIVGTVKSTDTTVELDIDASQVPPEFAPRAGDQPTVDLTAGWYDRGTSTWEEFYYTTFSMADLPRFPAEGPVTR
jgi:hypothetical protein